MVEPWCKQTIGHVPIGTCLAPYQRGEIYYWHPAWTQHRTIAPLYFILPLLALGFSSHSPGRSKHVFAICSSLPCVCFIAAQCISPIFSCSYNLFFCWFSTSMWEGNPIDCVFCCDGSLSHPELHNYQFFQVHSGLTCKTCSKFSCEGCLQVIVAEMEEKNLRDDWYDYVVKFLSGLPTPLAFRCSFCEWSINLECSKPHMPRRFDGYLFLPDYALMICPNFAGVDIIALGQDSPNNLDAVLHAVVDEETSIKCESQNVVPDKTAARIADMYTRMISFNGRDIKVCGYCMIMNS